MLCPHALLRRRSTAVLSKPFPFWHNRFAVRFQARVMLHGHMEELWAQNRCSLWATEKPRRQVQSWILTSEGLSQYPTSVQRHERHKVSARRFDRQAALRTVWQSEAHGISKRKLKIFTLAPSHLTGCVSPEREAIWEPLCSPPSPGSTSVRATEATVTRESTRSCTGGSHRGLANTQDQQQTLGGYLFTSLTVYTNKWSSIYPKRGESGSEQQTY